MKNIICIFLFFSISWAAWAQTDTEQIVVPLSSPNQIGLLHVSLINGSIKVTGYNGKDVIINAKSREIEKKDCDCPSEKPKEISGMKRIAGSSMELTATEENNKVTISSNSWKNAIDLEIKVPFSFNLKLRTVNYGIVRVEGLSGEMEINNTNDDVELIEISGSVVVNSVNGLIKVSFKQISENTPMAFTTLNGNVDITLPANTKFKAKMKSDRGEIYSDFDMDIEKTAVKADKSNGSNFKVSLDNWVVGKVNGGTTEFLFKNMNGDILLRKGK